MGKTIEIDLCRYDELLQTEIKYNQLKNIVVKDNKLKFIIELIEGNEINESNFCES